LSRVSILRDFCSMRVMMDSRFSSASGYAADEAIPPATGQRLAAACGSDWLLCTAARSAVRALELAGC
jgi:hypothetical protein